MRSGSQMLVAVLVLGTLGVVCAQDVSTVLAQYPQYSKFNELLKQTGVLAEVNSRQSMTILLPNDGALNGYVSSHPTYTTQMVADVIRFHCLLQYFSIDEIKLQVTPLTVTTLYQTTGRGNNQDGHVNITAQQGGVGTVGPATVGPPANPFATITTNLTQYPYNYSFFEITNVMEPLNLASAQLAPSAPPSMAPAPVPTPMADTPVKSPTSTPVESPTSTPVESPTVETPVESPTVETPVESPTTTTPVESPTDVSPVSNPPVPTAPLTEGPSTSPNSSGVALQVSFVALVASVAAAFMI